MAEDRTKDLACVVYFLMGARKQMFNAHTGDEALSALCRLLDLNEAALKLKLQGFI